MVNTGECQGKNRGGGPCSATPRTGRTWCVWHDPDLVEQRRRWNREAGRAKSNTARAKKRLLASSMELREVDSALCLALEGVLSGQIEPGVASAAASLARAIVQVRNAGDLEERLTALELAAEGRQGS